VFFLKDSGVTFQCTNFLYWLTILNLCSLWLRLLSCACSSFLSVYACAKLCILLYYKFNPRVQFPTFEWFLGLR